MKNIVTFKQLDVFDPPPSNKELLVLSPDNILHIAQYRSAYDIFDCMDKYASRDGWRWAEIEIKTEEI